ncbi:MAG: hypothetical protein M3285_03010 [Actinomycetota bacterium]|nr:hypothetical protein [Actinomycetota bacterium]
MLTEQDATRIAASLDDYDHVSLRQVRSTPGGFFEVLVTDHRFHTDYVLGSHCDYWDFVGALVDHRQCVSLTPLKPAAVMHVATDRHDFDGDRWLLPIDRDDEFGRDVLEFGLEVSLALAQENETTPEARSSALSERFFGARSAIVDSRAV